VYCSNCGSTKISKNGLKNGKQTYRCATCGSYATPIFGDKKVEIDKKVGTVNWLDFINNSKERQYLRHKASNSQNEINVSIQSDTDIVILPKADLHIGSGGTDYDALIDYTNILLENENVYTFLMGDLIDNFVNFKNIMAVHSQILNPEEQLDVFEDWLNTIKHKVLASTWGNHEEFSEKFEGRNPIKRILSSKVAYLDGMGSVTVQLNGIPYYFMITHKPIVFSQFNRTHGLKRMMREQFPTADIGIAGDKHVPDKETYFEGNSIKLVIQTGTLKTNDIYSKRYFANSTSPDAPCVVLNHKEKSFVDFWRVEDALRFAGSSSEISFE